MSIALVSGPSGHAYPVLSVRPALLFECSQAFDRVKSKSALLGNLHLTLQRCECECECEDEDYESDWVEQGREADPAVRILSVSTGLALLRSLTPRQLTLVVPPLVTRLDESMLGAITVDRLRSIDIVRYFHDMPLPLDAVLKLIVRSAETLEGVKIGGDGELEAATRINTTFPCLRQAMLPGLPETRAKAAIQAVLKQSPDLHHLELVNGMFSVAFDGWGDYLRSSEHSLTSLKLHELKTKDVGTPARVDLDLRAFSSLRELFIENVEGPVLHALQLDYECCISPAPSILALS